MMIDLSAQAVLTNIEQSPNSYLNKIEELVKCKLANCNYLPVKIDIYEWLLPRDIMHRYLKIVVDKLNKLDKNSNFYYTLRYNENKCDYCFYIDDQLYKSCRTCNKRGYRNTSYFLIDIVQRWKFLKFLPICSRIILCILFIKLTLY